MAEANSLSKVSKVASEAALLDGGEWSRGLQPMPKPVALGPAVLIASLAINLLSLGLPVVLLQVYDRILPNSATETLGLLVTGLCVVLLLDGVLRMARSYITGWGGARYEHGAGCAAMDRLLASDIRTYESEAPGVHLDRLNAIDTLRDFHAGQAKLLIVDLPFIVIFLGLIHLIGGPLILVPIGLILILLGVSVILGRKLKSTLEERSTLDDRRYNFIIEVLNGVHTVKALAMEALLQRRYERLQESGAASTYRVTFLSNMAQGLGAFFSNLTMVAVATVGATFVITEQLSIGGLAACTMLAGRSVQPILRALGLWTQLQSIAVARRRVDVLFELPRESSAKARHPGRIKGAVTLDKLSFRYDENSPLLLKEVSLRVRPGEVVAITGGTGNGKSSLLMLVIRALRPTEGRVLIDDACISDIDPHELRRQVAYLSQSSSLMQGTILENLASFRGIADVEAGLAAAHLLKLDEVVNRLPAGLETRVGDGAHDALPVGVKQGICLARALAGNPGVILFDEANSSLDAKSDKILKDALASLKGGPSMIMVSHRPSYLALADRIFELSDGQLVEREPQSESKPEARPESRPEATEAAPPAAAAQQPLAS